MSLEQQLDQLRDAIKENTDALNKNTAAHGGSPSAGASEARVSGGAGRRPGGSAAAAGADAGAGAGAAGAAAGGARRRGGAAATAPQLTLPEVQAKLMSVRDKVNREECLAILKDITGLAANEIDNIKPEHFAAIVEECDKAIAAVNGAGSSL